ncbi:MAG: hypothetical protein WC455_15295 [Dehalococcoidia bacterium]|jgi:hypothetical protein
MKYIKNLGIRTCKTGKAKSHWGLFECPKCGGIVEKQVANGKRDLSCGCTHYDVHYKHGLTHHNRSGHDIYNVWRGMIARCYTPTAKAYDRYGGRGIDVCAAWKNDCVAFSRWATGNGWRPGLTLDRINNDGPYHPDNCRFVTPFQNRINASDVKLNEHIVTLIRAMYSSGGFTYSGLGKLFSISGSQAGRIVKHQTWRGIA